MKKIGLMLLVLLFTPLSHALDAKGTIDEIKVCGTGNEKSGTWIRTLQFKVNGKWFGTFTDYYNYAATDYNDNISSSLILMAYAQNSVVEVHFTDPWVAEQQKCGVSEGAAFHGNAGDYIKLVR